jgi:hypothetical protein
VRGPGGDENGWRRGHGRGKRRGRLLMRRVARRVRGGGWMKIVLGCADGGRGAC